MSGFFNPWIYSAASASFVNNKLSTGYGVALGRCFYAQYQDSKFYLFYSSGIVILNSDGTLYKQLSITLMPYISYYNGKFYLNTTTATFEMALDGSFSNIKAVSSSHFHIIIVRSDGVKFRLYSDGTAGLSIYVYSSGGSLLDSKRPTFTSGYSYNTNANVEYIGGCCFVGNTLKFGLLAGGVTAVMDITYTSSLGAGVTRYTGGTSYPFLVTDGTNFTISYINSTLGGVIKDSRQSVIQKYSVTGSITAINVRLKALALNGSNVLSLTTVTSSSFYLDLYTASGSSYAKTASSPGRRLSDTSFALFLDAATVLLCAQDFIALLPFPDMIYSYADANCLLGYNDGFVYPTTNSVATTTGVTTIGTALAEPTQADGSASYVEFLAQTLVNLEPTRSLSVGYFRFENSVTQAYANFNTVEHISDEIFCLSDINSLIRLNLQTLTSKRIRFYEGSPGSGNVSRKCLSKNGADLWYTTTLPDSGTGAYGKARFVKLDSDLNPVSTSYSSSGDANGESKAKVYDSSGNYYLISTEGRGVRVEKYNSGNVNQWAKSYIPTTVTSYLVNEEAFCSEDGGLAIKCTATISGAARLAYLLLTNAGSSSAFYFSSESYCSMLASASSLFITQYTSAIARLRKYDTSSLVNSFTVSIAATSTYNSQFFLVAYDTTYVYMLVLNNTGAPAKIVKIDQSTGAVSYLCNFEFRATGNFLASWSSGNQLLVRGKIVGSYLYIFVGQSYELKWAKIDLTAAFFKCSYGDVLNQQFIVRVEPPGSDTYGTSAASPTSIALTTNTVTPDTYDGSDSIGGITLTWNTTHTLAHKGNLYQAV